MAPLRENTSWRRRRSRIPHKVRPSVQLGLARRPRPRTRPRPSIPRRLIVFRVGCPFSTNRWASVSDLPIQRVPATVLLG